ncbi:MAG: hypothetical protein A4E66_02613 [Syntrophus sp. PtaB.Bin001]|nr:MAG: hypothetical protein A4E66_02613 [Syntrophus sp. PtaB.Bin001]
MLNRRIFPLITAILCKFLKQHYFLSLFYKLKNEKKIINNKVCIFIKKNPSLTAKYL